MTRQQQIIDDLNFARDPRNSKPASTVLYLDDGTEKELPTTWAVCPVCNGEGKTVNPAIDAGGLSAEDFADDPDFAGAYYSGTFDIPCRHCNGRTTVRAVDWDALSDDDRKAYEAQLRADAEYEAERLAEIRMGA